MSLSEAPTDVIIIFFSATSKGRRPRPGSYPVASQLYGYSGFAVPATLPISASHVSDVAIAAMPA